MMRGKMQRRWLFPILLAVLVLVLAWGVNERTTRLRFLNAVEAQNQRDFYNFVSEIEQTEVFLAKALVAGNSHQQMLNLLGVWNQAAQAQASLGQLTLKNLNLAATRKFFAQLGDYAYTLARQLATGKELTPKDRQQLTRYHAEVGDYARELHTFTVEITNSGFRWATNLNPELPRFLPHQVQANQGRTSPPDFDRLAELDRHLQGLPQLIYDGPFSDHMLVSKPQGLTGPEVDATQAREKALAFVESTGVSGYQVAAKTALKGPLAGYYFTLKNNKYGGEIGLAVSKKGGHVTWLLNSRPVRGIRLTPAEAQRGAQAFLGKQGFPKVQVVGAVEQGSNCIVSFAAVQKGVILASDLIKVKIARDNGQVVGWEAQSYFMHHRPRELPSAKLTAAEAHKRLGPGLTPERTRLVLLSLPGGSEVLTYEIKARKSSDRFLVYINARNGNEEEITKIIPQPEGELVL